MRDLLWSFLSTEGFQPHGMCLLWRADVFWLHVGSDLAITLSYLSIPIAVVYFAYRRPDIQYGWILYLFGAFIVLCGATHLFGLWTMWVPAYGVEALVKLATALISVTTAIALWPLMPKALRVPSPRQLDEKNALLAREVERRREAEADLREINEQLEARVAERAASLERANVELEEARAAAEAANAAKGDFLAAMSHEIRTPMNGVMGMLELLREARLQADEARLVGIAARSAQNLLGVINAILDYSRIEAGSVEIERTDFQPAALAAEVAELYAENAAQKGVSLTTDVAPATPALLEGDPTRIRQVMLNLVDNAVKFTETGSVRVELGAAALPDGQVELRFAVVDTGIGVAHASRDLLFRRFSQVDRSPSRRYGGTGLGLAICRELVTLMGGEIGYDGAPGEGSRFWFRIPCGSVASARRVADAQEPAPKVRPLRILAAEDNLTNQFLLQRLLSRHGHAVELVQTGREAVAAAAASTFDLVLMDVQMPDMDGLAAARRIRALEGPANAVPIVAITAHALESDRARCLAAGMNDFVTKPITPQTLFVAIARAVGASGGGSDLGRRTA